MTLTGLSERSGIAKSTLSLLEASGGNPTVDTVWALANALGIPFGSLVDDADHDAGEFAGPGSIVRLVERATTEPRIEAYSVELQPGCRRQSAPHPQGVKERVTVIAGSMIVGDTARPRLLRAGETHDFDADRPHVYAATDDGARALVVIEYPLHEGVGASHTVHLDWPASSEAWAGVRAAFQRALVETSNGAGPRLLRVGGDAMPAAPDARQHLREMVAGAVDARFGWPLAVTVENDEQGAWIAVFPQSGSAAFAASSPPSGWPGEAFATDALRLARQAEAWLAPLTEVDRELAKGHASGSSWTLSALAAEVLMQRGLVQLPKRLTQQVPVIQRKPRAVHDESFSSRIDVQRYDAFELLHPAYARQVVALAQDVAEFAAPAGGSEIVDVGTGPGVPLLMLRELHPGHRYIAVEPDDAAFACLTANLRGVDDVVAQQIGFLEFGRNRASSVSLLTSVGASHHFNTAFMLQHAQTLLQPGSCLVVADEFLPEFATPQQRNRALVLHHAAYIAASAAWIGDDGLDERSPEVSLYRSVRRDIVMARLAAIEGSIEQAMSICRGLLRALQAGLADRVPDHPVGSFLRFFALELQAMVAGFDYEVERKTFVSRFVELAAMTGLELLRHRRVFATVGSDEWGGGTHVICLRKPGPRR